MTLIEVIIALGILATIGVLTLSTVSSTLKARDVLAEEDEVQQSARVALDTLTHELRLAYLSWNKNSPNTYRTVFVGKDTGDIDTLWFASLSHQRLYQGAREGDQTEITIWGDDDPYHDGRYVLLHREAPRIDHEPDEGGVIQPMSYNVRSLSIRYLDPQTCEWADEWDSTAVEQLNRLPRAVQFSLTLMGPDPDEDGKEKPYTFASTTVLQYGKRARCAVFANDENDEGEISASGDDS
ncbi:MAG: type II secretion system protein GspJ [Myxococcota bacterium]|nr:type II secretion system protein GspJ [Myxococcota bacterium]